MRGLIGGQVVVALVVAVIMLYRESAAAMLAALYGASIGMAVTLLVRRSTDKALEKAIESPQQGILVMFSGFVLRYVIVILGLLVGLNVLKLMTVPVLAGFISVIMAQVFGAHRVKS